MGWERKETRMILGVFLWFECMFISTSHVASSNNKVKYVSC